MLVYLNLEMPWKHQALKFPFLYLTVMIVFVYKGLTKIPEIGNTV